MPRLLCMIIKFVYDQGYRIRLLYAFEEAVTAMRLVLAAVAVELPEPHPELEVLTPPKPNIVKDRTANTSRKTMLSHSAFID
jgi:hypothetical protein